MAPATSVLDLGAHLRAIRRDRGLTQADVARAAGVSRAFVVDLEGGRRAGAELARVLAVARALGLGIDLVPYERPGFDDALDPLLGTTCRSREVNAYLKGSLPDHADVRERWARRLGARSGDVLGLVAAIGADVAGGAVFAEPDRLDDLLAAPGEVEPSTEVGIAARLRALREDDRAWHEDDEHGSLAGGQDKFTLATTPTGGWGIASGSAPSTHIVKPGIARIRAQAMVEHVTMRTLALAGLRHGVVPGHAGATAFARITPR